VVEVAVVPTVEPKVTGVVAAVEPKVIGGVVVAVVVLVD